MDYTQSFRSGPSRLDREADFEAEYYGLRPSHYSAPTGRADYDGARDRPEPSSAAPRRNHGDGIPLLGTPPPPPGTTYREQTGSSRRPPPLEEELEYGDPGPSVRRPTSFDTPLTYAERLERREREEPVEDMEMPRIRRRPQPPRRELEYGDAGPSLRPPPPPRPPPVDGEQVQDKETRIVRVDIPRTHHEVPPRPRPTVERHRPRIIRRHDLEYEHRVPPRPVLAGERPVIYNTVGGRGVPPGGPPRGPPRRPPNPSPSPPPRRRLPLGFVQPAPPLNHPEKVTGHDLASLAQRPNPNSGQDVRDNLVLCVYRNSKKTFDYRLVELTSFGNRLDRRFKEHITDRHLFRNMRSRYEKQLRGWVRRLLSFKALTTVRLLQYGNGQFFRPEQDDILFSLTFMKIWKNPNEQLGKHSVEWLSWVLEAKELHPEFDMAIELIEDYIPERIVLFAGLGLLGIVALTSAWLVKGGNPGNVATVMSFVLGFVAALVALTGIWDWFDGGRSKEMQQHATVALPRDFLHAPRIPPPYAPNFGSNPFTDAEFLNSKRPKDPDYDFDRRW